MDISFSPACQGIKSAIQMQAQSAGQIANLNSSDTNTALASEMVNQMKSQHQIGANVAAVKTTDIMLGSIIDLVA